MTTATSTPTDVPLLCLLGASGVGKSELATRIARRAAWLHLELDRFPDGDGRAALGLTTEFDALLQARDPQPLVAELRERASRAGAPGCVLSFPSGVLLSAQQAAASAALGMRVAYLHGPPQSCLASFLARERSIGRGLDAAYWHANNTRLLQALAHPSFDPYRVAAFDAAGMRRDDVELIGELIGHAATGPASESPGARRDPAAPLS